MKLASTPLLKPRVSLLNVGMTRRDKTTGIKGDNKYRRHDVALHPGIVYKGKVPGACLGPPHATSLGRKLLYGEVLGS
jgi:hypothetical protein